jgi:nucleoside-diphosphate-sugar epimerase
MGDDAVDMRVTILGSTGRVGSRALEAARSDGHEVVILVRAAPEVALLGVSTIVGAIDDAAVVREAVAGSAAVIAAIGPRSNDAAAAHALISGMRTLIEAMDHEHVDRLVTLSGAAVDAPGDRKPWLDRIASSVVRRAARHVVAAKQGEFEVLVASSLAWTALRPAIVTDGPARGYRLSDTLRPGARVTRADVGRALVDVLADQAQIGKAPFVLPR